MLHPLRLGAALVALALLGAGSARAASPIEGVWSFGGGKISIAGEANGSFTGTVTAAAKFSSCTHGIGEKVWTTITSQPDGSYWGRHQWFTGTSCTPIATLGPAAWRVLTNGSGSTYLAFCTSEPGGPQPKIGPTGATSGAAQCINSGPLPDTTIGSGPSGLTTSASPSFGFASTEAGSFECRLDAAPSWSPCTTPKTYGALAEGPHRFEVRAKTALGDADPTPALADFSVDTIAPTTSINAEPSNPSASAAASFGFTGSDSGSGVRELRCSLDGAAFAACGSPISYASLGQGPHQFEVEAIDNAGNTGAASAYAWTVDTIAPETTITSGPDGPIAATKATFKFSSTEAGSFECRLDSSAVADWGSCDSPITYSDLKQGEHRFEVRAADGVGNTDPTPAVASFSVDVNAPDTTITDSPLAPIASASEAATFAFTATETGSFECRLDSADPGAWGACTSPISYTSLAEGDHSFEVRALDALGNTDPSPATASFRVDTPVNGERVAVAPVSGKVKIQTPDAHTFRPLLEGETIPVGSVIDTSEGKARLTSVDAGGEEQSANFFDGIFRVGQRPGRGLVTLRLRGGDFGDCSAAGASVSRGRSGRRLWGSGHGNFRTEGSAGSATVRGTIWLTEDNCEGTFVKVRRGRVAVRDFARGKTILVPAGKSYLARGGA